MAGKELRWVSLEPHLVWDRESLACAGALSKVWAPTLEHPSRVRGHSPSRHFRLCPAASAQAQRCDGQKLREATGKITAE